MTKPFLLAISLAFFLLGCTATLPEPLAAENPDDAELILKGLPDPIEPFNRAMFATNEVLFDYVAYPVSKGYSWVVPESGREGIDKFYKNAMFPIRLVNNLLQAKWEGAWVETKRFGINTTVGILGFRDPAMNEYQLRSSNQDLGLTLGNWGWDSQMYLFLPFLGGSSERDLLGTVGDSFIDPTSIYWPVKGALTFNEFTLFADTLHKILKQEYEPYELTRLLYSIKRTPITQLISFDSDPDSGKVQTLRTIFAGPDDAEFVKLSQEREVQPEGFRKPLKYNVWMNEGADKTVMVLPGLGGFRVSNSTLSLAEMAYEEGYNVITFSNTFNWEFVSSASKDYLPGYVPDDLAQMRLVYTEILEDVDAQFGEEKLQSVSLMGASMGAWYALNLMANKQEDSRLDRCIAINPPFDLVQGLLSIDEMYRAPFKNRDVEGARKKVNAIILKALASYSSGILRPNVPVPFTDEEASFLIGLSFRLTLRDTMFAGQYEDLESVFKKRSDIYRSLSALSFKDYYEKMVVSKLEKRGITRKEIDTHVSLGNKLDKLKQEDGIRLFLTDNDFLLKPSQLQWFKDNFKGKYVLYEKGGHLGNLWEPRVKEKIRSQLR